ncbi:hypothetical protein [uncultured Massilia sp.]|uniref:hypothetical protein n=1 Tax=uncultured Massilia sp. TaxID=169973 RepID=UPI0025E655DB|nr:hypothetical protein [uncultured Massilia sp.]
MEDLKDPSTTVHAAPGAPARPRRRWLRALLYLLAAVGVLALALIGYAVYRHGKDAGPPRVAIDETAVIDDVMAQTYGKYSAARKGWLYVGDDNITYLMRVVQQARIPDGADGDELYFIASGTAVDGSENAMYGAFHVHPNHPNDGNLAQVNTQIRYPSTQAVRPEQVHFEALSENLWGWVVKAQTGTDPELYPVTVTNTVLAPHGDEIAVLGEFLASRESNPGRPCDEAKAAWEAYNRPAPAGSGDEDEGIDETEEPLRCEKRRWTYRTATVNGNVPVPITVTVGGTLDGQAVEARTWKMMFDPKSFAYDVPAELKNQ